jgi:hypothetical protein
VVLCVTDNIEHQEIDDAHLQEIIYWSSSS